MPALYSHYLFTSAILEELPYKLNDNQKKLVIIGAQGSDPLYFYGKIFPRENTEKVNFYASKLHHQDPSSFISFFIDYANNQTKELKDNLFSYLYGYISHYTLDRNVHPYVFYHSGIKGLYNHQVFEANLDLELLINKNKQEEIKAKIVLDRKGIKKTLVQISEIFYLYAVSHNFEGIDAKSFIKGVKDITLAAKLLCSPKGKRKWFFNIFMKNKSANALAIPPKPYLGYDYLNLKRNNWKYPSTKKITNKSILDILDEAYQDYLKSFIFLNIAYEKGDYKVHLKEWTKEIDHDGKHYLAKNIVAKSIL